MRVLDVGTGTGVLAIAAARTLRGTVLASDIDPVSVRLARQNARLNRAAGLTVIHARGLGDRRFRDGAPYDLVFANILLGPAQGAGEADRRSWSRPAPSSCCPACSRRRPMRRSPPIVPMVSCWCGAFRSTAGRRSC